MPLEVLAILEGVQKHLQCTFSAEEIKTGILEGLLIETDYDMIGVVSIHVQTRLRLALDLLCLQMCSHHVLFQLSLFNPFRKRNSTLRNVKFSLMRPKGYFIRNQDSLKQQRMNLKVPTIYYPISIE